HQRVICLMCFGFHQKPKAIQTVKLTVDHRENPTTSIYRSLIHRFGPNRPHISSDTGNFKERQRQNQPTALFILSAARLINHCFCLPPASSAAMAFDPFGVPLAPQRRR
ncbi:MAG: hypothetical protein AAGA70_17520, partial [Pseudomonadota bacterium]